MIKKAAIGLRAHSGWAALVAVTGPIDAPEVIGRRRIEIADPTIRGSKQPFHAAEPLEFPEAKAHIECCRQSTGKLAREALEAAIQALRDRGAKVVGCGILLASGRELPGLEAILKSHALIHTAEGEFFRQALMEAAKHCELPVCGIKEKQLYEQVAAKLGTTASKMQVRIQNLGKSLGPPWTQDQKYATAAAIMALQEK